MSDFTDAAKMIDAQIVRGNELAQQLAAVMYELDEADWKIAQIRDALTWINSPEFILNSIKEILKEDA